MKRYLGFVVVMVCFLFLGSAMTPPATLAAEPIKMGVMATLTGAFATLGEEGVDGVNMALEEVDFKIAGRPVKLYKEDTAADPDTAVTKCRALVSRDGCQVIAGPLSGAEGLAVKKSADEFANATILTICGAEDVTMRGVKPNVFRPAVTGAQSNFPLGEYAYEQGYRKVVTLAEDYAFPYAQIGGFMKTFCARGGCVAKKFWVPIGTSDYSSIFPQIPRDIDAICLAISGTDVINFITQMEEFGVLGKVPILGGSTAIDASVLHAVGKQLDGVISASGMVQVYDTPAFKEFDQRYMKLRGRPPSLFVLYYYLVTKFARLALEEINGEVEDQEAFRGALQKIAFESPVGHVSLDKWHNMTQDCFINQVKFVEGHWKNVPIKVFPQVSQFWTFDPEEYQKQPSYDRSFVDCPCK